jgi:DNA-binding beta-propeller fold protein YncE
VSGYDEKELYAVDLGTFTRMPAADIPLRYTPNQLALYPDGHDVFVMHQNALPGNQGAISVVDVNSATVSLFDNLPDVKVPVEIAFSPDGSKAYVAEQYYHGGPPERLWRRCGT